MINNQYYETIFQRKSIRKFDMASLPDKTLAELKNFTMSIKPLDEKIKVEFCYLAAGEVSNILPNKGPHYICLYSEKKDNYLMNAGFLLQQIDLYLSANDIGSCWLGMAKPLKKASGQCSGLEFVIMLVFGRSEEPVHRSNSIEFNRKPIYSITNIPGANALLEPVRLAPSASNTQPWFFSGTKEEITVSREKLSIVKAPLYGKMNQIDTGIAMCHLWLALEREGSEAVFDFNTAAAPNGYEFMAKVIPARK